MLPDFLSPPPVHLKDGCIRFVADPSYEISLNRIDSAFSLLSWVRHMGEKTWVTSETLVAFIEVVCEAKGWTNELHLSC